MKAATKTFLLQVKASLKEREEAQAQALVLPLLLSLSLPLPLPLNVALEVPELQHTLKNRR